MFIKFNGQLYNMNNIHTVYWGETYDDESDNPKIVGYRIRLLGKDLESISCRSYSFNQIKKWEKECRRVEQWLLGYR